MIILKKYCCGNQRLAQSHPKACSVMSHRREWIFLIQRSASIVAFRSARYGSCEKTSEVS
jgi:hypothetical protein